MARPTAIIRVGTGIWARGPEDLARLEAHNAAVGRIRSELFRMPGAPDGSASASRSSSNRTPT